MAKECKCECNDDTSDFVGPISGHHYIFPKEPKTISAEEIRAIQSRPKRTEPLTMREKVRHILICRGL